MFFHWARRLKLRGNSKGAECCQKAMLRGNISTRDVRGFLKQRDFLSPSLLCSSFGELLAPLDAVTLDGGFMPLNSAQKAGNYTNYTLSFRKHTGLVVTLHFPVVFSVVITLASSRSTLACPPAAGMKLSRKSVLCQNPWQYDQTLRVIWSETELENASVVQVLWQSWGSHRCQNNFT